ncbi:ANTAR domain-containing protein [Allosaccharopolyspora coralli]|uniref:ANTAR domain-containing protein n=1 Tax=Allosaccharopolyspora coralli TaxID=2665642 RepID=A0A5Q3Q3X6_9PSEU|nr:GAF and ANTAR domain-containing protein [Allosaccharopolyspora coralli]QGK69318.1 ANTAR domain-containing protein [Allosaccharopolyspora coralli]
MSAELDPYTEELATSLAHMARDLLSEDTVEKTLDRIVSEAVARIDGCDEASIMILDRERTLRTVASTSEVGQESDRIQAKLGEGPCFDAAADPTVEVFRVADMGGSGERWPQYAPQARALGVGSMIGFRLFTNEQGLGALNLYSSQPDAFGKRSEQVGWLFASHAAVAFAAARNDAQLHEAIATRQGIGQAMGIIMHRYKVSEDEAFAVLKRVSQARNVKLRDIAHEVVETGEVPGAEGR